MKRLYKKNKKLTKGMPSAVVLSILIHAALFLLAGMLVVFTVVKKDEKKFVPPKAVERPKMKLRKPKVKVKKNATPKPTTRIVTKINRASMPDIQLPEMSGLGEGLTGGVGGFDMMPELETTLFGGTQSIGNDLVGTFYDFKRDISGRNIPYSTEEYLNALRKFVARGWKPSSLARYYHSPRKLYATTIMIPLVFSLVAPEAFGEPEVGGWCWAVHYQGELVHKEHIKFRFWGAGDDVLVVRVDGEIVLSRGSGLFRGIDMTQAVTPHWNSSSADSGKYVYGKNRAAVGDWITLEAGVSKDIDILIGEAPGGRFQAMLAVEVEGVDYERGPQGNPILPIFKTAVQTRDQVETIHENLVPGETCVTNGPVFCDYDISGAALYEWESEPIKAPLLEESVKPEPRPWSIIGEDRVLDGIFITIIGDKAVLKDVHGRSKKIPLDKFSEEDRLYIELARPPKFNIDFSKKSSQRFFEESPILSGAEWLPKQLDYVFSARLKQTSAGKYNHELKVEFFAIGKEIEGDNYILLDRQESRFTPTTENGRSLTFSGNKVILRDGMIMTERRGQKYGGYLVVATDERGLIVDYGSSHNWLLGTVNNLRKLLVGRHFNKAGERVEPPRPRPTGVY